MCTPNDCAKAAFEGLSSIADQKSDVVLVTVHGVGDHCPGYALDPKKGWLSDKTLRAIGVNLTSPNRPDYDHLLLSETLWIDANDVSRFAFQPVGDLSIEVGPIYVVHRNLGRFGRTNIHAVEVTWSGLTRRFKTMAFVNDHDTLSEVQQPAAQSDENENCLVDMSSPMHMDSALPAPPKRAALNKYLKEDVLDHSMADAAIYGGYAKKALQHALAEALCQSALLVSRPGSGEVEDHKPCDYNAAKTETEKSNRIYVFLTHSLGSRMIYDLLIGLGGYDEYGDTVFDIAGSDAKASAFVSALLQTRPSIFMMANQLSMIGLTSKGRLVDLVNQDAKVKNARDRDLFLMTPEQLSALRKEQECTRAKPQFIAYSDFNDLLTWPIISTIDQKHFCFFNVFVSNSPSWLGLAENPGPAHSGYFAQDDVLESVKCGAKDGRIIKACQPN